MRTWLSNRLVLPFLLGLAGCSSSHDESEGVEVAPGDPFGNYDSGNVSVIGEADEEPPPAASEPDPDEPPTSTGTVLVGTPEGEGDVGEMAVCVDGLCSVPPVDTSNWCERDGGPVDLIYVDGVLVETICYPPADDPDRPTMEIDTTTPGDIEVVQTANNTTVTFDPATNGTPIEGNIAIDGNNVAIYGNGPDETIIDGDVMLDGNTVRLRGVTITGDLILMKNRAAVVLCRIEGNVRLSTTSTNGSVFAENDIWGDFTSDSNNNVFVANDVLGLWEHVGNNNTCDDNSGFADENDDGLVDDEERTEQLTCQ
jgi:hypothetical protein